MFQKFKNLDEGFRQVRMVVILMVLACTVISLFAVWYGLSVARRAQDRIYVLAGGVAMGAVAADRAENIPVEGRDHIAAFHRLFFTVEPDEKAIAANMGRAFYLGDGSVRMLYNNLKEAGFFTGMISGSVSQAVTIDSIHLDLNVYPFRWQCWATEKLTRPTSITIRNLITTGLLRNTARSDNNAHGFLIEKLEVLDNHDLLIKNR